MKDNNTKSDAENLQGKLDELKGIRSQLAGVENAEDRNKIIEELLAKIGDTEQQAVSSDTDKDSLDKSLDDIENQIADMQRELDKLIKEYDKSYYNMRSISDEHRNAVKNSDSLSEEELASINSKYASMKKEENKNSNSIKQQIEDHKRQINNLKKKRQRIKKKIEEAKELGISGDDLHDINGALRKTTVMNSILEQKGLSDITTRRGHRKTAEEKQAYDEEKKKIVKEISEIKSKDKSLSILDAIEILYSIKVNYVSGKAPKVILVNQNQLNNIKNKVASTPKKIKGDTPTQDYEPGKVPSDLQGMLANSSDDLIDSGRVYIEPILLRGLNYEQTQARYREAVINQMMAKGKVYNPETMDVVILGAEADPAASDILYTSYEVRNKKKEEEKTVSPKLLDSDRIYIEPILLRGMSYEQTQEKYREEAIKQMMAKGIPYNPDTMEVVIVGAEADPAASDILYTVYEVYEKQNEKEKEKEKIKAPAVVKPAPVVPYNNAVIAGVPAVIPPKPSFMPNGGSNNLGSDDSFGSSSSGAGGSDPANPSSPSNFGDNNTKVPNFSPTSGDNPVGDDSTPSGLDDDSNDLDSSMNSMDIKYTNRDVVDRITFFRDVDNNGDIYVRSYVVGRFNINPISDNVNINGFVCQRISQDDADYIMSNQNNSFSPYQVVVEDVRLGKRKVPVVGPDVQDIVLFRDVSDNNQVYANRSVLDQFGIASNGDMVQIEGDECYPITSEEEQQIHVASRISRDPIINIHYRDVNLKEKDLPKQDEITITLYRDLDDNNQVYASEDVLSRFGITPDGDATKIEGKDCYKVDDEAVGQIRLIAENSQDPVVNIEYKDVHLGKELPDQDEITITLYRDLDDNNQVYASGDVLSRFGITPAGDTTEIEGKDCYKISDETDAQIYNMARASQKPIIHVEYKNVHLKKEERRDHSKPAVQSIIAKLTKDLHIKSKDGTRFIASNMRISSAFKEELQSGNWVYNVIHILPAASKLVISAFSKLASKLLLTKRGKEAMSKFQERLDQLSEEELEVLFDEYKGTEAKASRNKHFNYLILGKLKQYALGKVDNLNAVIKDNYTLLFTILGETKAIEQRLAESNLSNEDREALSLQRESLISMAASSVRSILESRKKANDILSSGIHGLEEDFKSIQQNRIYEGFRFAKDSDFDDELQQLLGKYDQGLEDALYSNDDEAIVSNFMGKESCFFKNTKVSGSIFGKRSVGSKYYSPFAEEFDYRDDPFIRDLFTTFALASAAVSAVNAIRVHGIESRQLLQQQQADVARVNKHNDDVMNQVHQTGRDIEGYRGTFAEGMKAQSNEDVLSSADVLERGALDKYGWHFGDAYRKLDRANHKFYNQFNDSVTHDINDITARYGQGAIDQAQALSELSQLANRSHGTLVSVCNKCLSSLRAYKKANPRFDLHGIEQSMDYIVDHPDAIAEMNQGMVDVTNLAGGLAGLSVEHATALSRLPSDVLSTLVCAASAAGLASHVASTMKSKHTRQNHYGNEITKMMGDYLNSSMESEEENVRQR